MGSSCLSVHFGPCMIAPGTPLFDVMRFGSSDVLQRRTSQSSPDMHRPADDSAFSEMRLPRCLRLAIQRVFHREGVCGHPEGGARELVRVAIATFCPVGTDIVYITHVIARCRHILGRLLCCRNDRTERRLHKRSCNPRFGPSQKLAFCSHTQLLLASQSHLHHHAAAWCSFKKFTKLLCQSPVTGLLSPLCKSWATK